MNTKVRYKKRKILKWDWLLIIGLTMAPMTGLRVWKVGPSEILCLLWCLPHMGKVLHLRLSDFYLKFWMFFLMTIFWGSIYGSVFYPKESDALGIFTYIYLAFISLGVYCGLNKKNTEDILEIFKAVCSIVPIVYLLLYIYSMTVSRTFFGAPLWYGGYSRFSGGGTNPHQLAVLIAAVLFGNMIFLFRGRSKKMLEKILRIVYIVICYFIGQKTASSTLVMSIAITTFFALCIVIIQSLKSSKIKLGGVVLIMIIVLISIILFENQIRQFVYSWILSDENGYGRFAIYETIDVTLKKNSIIGLGPGMHALNGTFEYHNTYLEILAMSGVIGLTIFLVFSVQIFKRLKKNIELALVIIPLYCYGLAGFAMRRLAYWCILSIVLVLSEKLRIKDEKHEMS